MQSIWMEFFIYFSELAMAAWLTQYWNSSIWNYSENENSSISWCRLQSPSECNFEMATMATMHLAKNQIKNFPFSIRCTFYLFNAILGEVMRERAAKTMDRFGCVTHTFTFQTLQFRLSVVMVTIIIILMLIRRRIFICCCFVIRAHSHSLTMAIYSDYVLCENPCSRRSTDRRRKSNQSHQMKTGNSVNTTILHNHNTRGEHCMLQHAWRHDTMSWS